MFKPEDVTAQLDVSQSFNNNCQSPKPVHAWQGHTHGVYRLKVLPSGKRLLSWSRQEEIKFWENISGQCSNSLVIDENIDNLAVLPGEKQLVISRNGYSRENEYLIDVWDIDNKKFLKTLGGKKYHTDIDGANYYEGDQHHRGRINSLAGLPGGQLASASSDKTIKIWDINSGQCLKTLERHTNQINTLVVLPGGQQLASGSEDSLIKIWDVEKGQCIKTLDIPNYIHSAIDELIVLPDGLLASVDGKIPIDSDDVDDTTMPIHIWDIRTGLCIHTLREHTDLIYFLALLPEGKIVSGSQDKIFKIWDIKSGHCLKTLHIDIDNIFALAILEGQLISGSRDGTIKIWQLDQLELASALQPTLRL